MLQQFRAASYFVQSALDGGAKGVLVHCLDGKKACMRFAECECVCARVRVRPRSLYITHSGVLVHCLDEMCLCPCLCIVCFLCMCV